jgi:hypothetical protein
LAYICSNLPLLGKFSSKTPNRNTGIVANREYYDVQFQTRFLATIYETTNFLYVDSTKNSMRIIQPDLYLSMDYIVLAHWIMGDGAKRNDGLTLCTDNFSQKDVVNLISILTHRFSISPTMHKEKKGFRIYINHIDLMKIRPHLLPHMVDHFIYKLDGEK